MRGRVRGAPRNLFPIGRKLRAVPVPPPRDHRGGEDDHFHDPGARPLRQRGDCGRESVQDLHGQGDPRREGRVLHHGRVRARVPLRDPRGQRRRELRSHARRRGHLRTGRLPPLHHAAERARPGVPLRGVGPPGRGSHGGRRVRVLTRAARDGRDVLDVHGGGQGPVQQRACRGRRALHAPALRRLGGDRGHLGGGERGGRGRRDLLRGVQGRARGQLRAHRLARWHQHRPGRDHHHRPPRHSRPGQVVRGRNRPRLAAASGRSGVRPALHPPRDQGDPPRPLRQHLLLRGAPHPRDVGGPRTRRQSRNGFPRHVLRRALPVFRLRGGVRGHGVRVLEPAHGLGRVHHRRDARPHRRQRRALLDCPAPRGAHQRAGDPRKHGGAPLDLLDLGGGCGRSHFRVRGGREVHVPDPGHRPLREHDRSAGRRLRGHAHPEGRVPRAQHRLRLGRYRGRRQREPPGREVRRGLPSHALRTVRPPGGALRREPDRLSGRRGHLPRAARRIQHDFGRVGDGCGRRRAAHDLHGHRAGSVRERCSPPVDL
mmetsp:Transcript_18174/g.43838  ORF Transcript_18174/g.43838 Transcript_18174/m.43838 type:complete len:542 (+) Transcript_18174:2048-3673(+)